MDQSTALEIISQSKSFSLWLSRIENDVFQWIDKKEKAGKAFLKQILQYTELNKENPGEWEKLCITQYIAGRIFGNPAKLRKFIFNHKDILEKEEKILLNYFVDHPWFYSLFEIIEILPDNILVARDFSRDENFYLYSRGVSELYKQGRNLFMCLLFFNGINYQTFSIIHSYKGYTVEDFIGFAQHISYHYNKSKDLSESICYNIVKYMLIDKYANIPIVVHQGEPSVYCSHTCAVDSFDFHKYEDQFDIEERDDIIQLTLKKYKETMFFTYMYYDRKQKHLLLHAVGLDRYHELAAIVKDICKFPQQPSWHMSMNMTTVLSGLCGIENPAFKYEELFSDASDSPDTENPALEPLNNLAAKLTDLINIGESYSIKELASQYNVPLETALEIEKIYSSMDEKFQIDLDHGFNDLKLIPPAQRRKFDASLKHNTIFTTHSLPEERFPGLGLGIETFSDYINLVDDLYYKFWNKRDYLILLYTFYLLHIKGNEFEDSDDYACECLRLFWQVILNSNSQREINRFIKKYRKFCIQVLFKTGLIELKAPPDHPFFSGDSTDDSVLLKTTPLFSDLFTFHI